MIRQVSPVVHLERRDVLLRQLIRGGVGAAGRADGPRHLVQAACRRLRPPEDGLRLACRCVSQCANSRARLRLQTAAFPVWHCCQAQASILRAAPSLAMIYAANQRQYKMPLCSHMPFSNPPLL